MVQASTPIDKAKAFQCVLPQAAQPIAYPNSTVALVMNYKLRLTRIKLLKMLMCDLRHLIDEKECLIQYTLIHSMDFWLLQLSLVYIYVMRDGLSFFP